MSSLALANGALAQGTAGEPRLLTLDECIQLALEHNLDLQIERHNPQIVRYNLDASRGAYDPLLDVRAVRRFDSTPGGVNPLTQEPFPPRETTTETFGPGVSGILPTGLRYDVSGEVVHRDIPGREYTAQAGVSLRQPLLRDFWIDTPRRNIRVGRKNIDIAESILLREIMSVVASVEFAYYDLIFARENVKVFEAAHQLADRLVQETRRRVEVGALAPLEETQAESQLAVTRADLLSARQELDVRENRLKNLLTDDYMKWHGREIIPAEALEAAPQFLDVMESWHRGMTQRPEILQRRLDLERRDIVLRYQRNQLFPVLDLVGSYGHNALERSFGGVLDDTRRGDTPFHSYGVIVSIPLGNRIARSNYRATKEEKAQALLGLKRLEQDILVAIDNAVKRVRTQFERVEATRQGRFFAEAALDAEQKKLEAGRSTSFVVLQLQRDLTAARSAEIRALTEYNQALAELAREEGHTLERHNLGMDVEL